MSTVFLGTPVHENWMIACVMAVAVSGMLLAKEKKSDMRLGSLVNPCLSAIVANFSDRRTQGGTFCMHRNACFVVPSCGVVLFV